MTEKKRKRNKKNIYIYLEYKVMLSSYRSPMSCIMNAAHAKRRCTFARHVAAIHKTTHKLRKNFLRQVVCRHATPLKRRESKGNRQTCHAMRARLVSLLQRQHGAVFTTIDPGAPLIINAFDRPSLRYPWNTAIVNSRTTLRRAPSLSFVGITFLLFRGLCHFRLSLRAQSRLEYLKISYAIFCNFAKV